MKDRNQNDNKFIKDQWFDDYCFYKLVIEEENNPTPSENPTGCGYTLMGVLLFLMFFFEIIKVFY